MHAGHKLLTCRSRLLAAVGPALYSGVAASSAASRLQALTDAGPFLWKWKGKNEMTFNPIKEFMQRREREAEEHAEATRLRAVEHMKVKARVAFLGAGGSSPEFEKAWPEIRTRLLADEAAQAVKGKR